MEELIGGLRDRWITQTARCDYPHAAVELKDIENTSGVLFRALGGSLTCGFFALGLALWCWPCC